MKFSIAKQKYEWIFSKGESLFMAKYAVLVPSPDKGLAELYVATAA